jgi:subtilisin family serine protease
LVIEGATSVAALSATDADGGALTFSIISGDDQSLFLMTPAGVLSFNTAPDFEAPGDSDTDNAYLLTVQVSDGALSDSQSLIVTVTDAFEGRVVDAPMSGAAVFIDLNGNSLLDADEPNGTTDANGYFKFDLFTPVAGIVPKIISKGGTDTKTAKALPNLALVSDVPADLSQAANVTPLTTVLSSVDTPEEKAQVLAALGISGTPEELLTTDGWAEAEAGDEDAKAAQRVNQQLGLLLQTATTLSDDGDADTDVSVALAQSVAKQVSTMAQAQGSVDLTASASIQSVLTQAAAEATPNVFIETSIIAAVASSVANVNTIVADPTLDPVSDLAQEIAESAQVNLQTSVAKVVSGEVDANDFFEDTSSTALFVNVVFAADAPDNDNDGVPDLLDSDDDGDGVADTNDAFPLDKTETLDTDADGTGNNADDDDDDDGVADTSDAFPLDKTETLDTDADGTGNHADTDDDGDGVADTADAFPLDNTETLDTDTDGTGNNADTDDDGDGVADTSDVFPLNKTETLDTDADGTGNHADTDDDGDGVADTNDAFPLDNTETLDTDADGTGNNADTDDDGDGVADTSDVFPLNKTEILDTDADGIGNNADTDDDGDGVADTNDAFPLDNTETLDTDADGTGNNADTDDDDDGVADTSDAFPLDKTETLDTDADGTGNNADTDDDNDGVADTSDAFPLDKTETLDTDADGTGNNADTDDDNDGVTDTSDAFPLDKTETLDTDADGTGNNADTDDDDDGVADTSDAFPLDSTETLDTDLDGTGNNTDTDDDGDGVDDTRDTNALDSSLTPPTAVLTLDVSEGPSPLLVSVNASSSIAGFGDDTIASYTWNFGDGDSSTEEVTSHIYTQVGSFEIALTLTNSDGFAHTATQTVTTSLVTDPLVIEGTILVSSSVTVDSDVNDSSSSPVSNNTIATAQFVTNPVTIGGFANEAGTGPNFDSLANLTTSGDEFDAYRINALGGEVINLRIATRGEGDLDLLLYDVDGQLIDFSVSATDNESIAIPAVAATYNIVVESFSGYSNYVLSVGRDPAIASLSNANASTAVFIGDLVVKPKNDHQTPSMLAQANRVIGAQASARASTRLYQFGDNITEMLTPRIRTRMLSSMATRGPSVTELKLATMLAAKQLNRQDGVEYAEPNYRLTTKIEPNDEFYVRQWHYRKLNLPAAWDKTTGSANVKIAVLDTGIVANHPDLQSRLSADSYDFISSVSNGGDGDGVDSDARDPGDGQDNAACSTSTSRSSSFHGTHVAGTIGASTNNNIGTAGIAWAGEIMNLRVLGCEGGSTFDIAQALLYAAGIENALGINPTKTADVANLSLGGGSPSNVMTNAVQAARAAGLIIVAAAGNDGNSTLSYPASYDGVISVAATDLSDRRAFYSQFNARVDIAAPGGDTSTDLDADGFPDGVLSTLASREGRTQIDYRYGFKIGTSMATPHVAGIVALMKSVNPALTPALLDQLLSSGAITVDLGASGRDDDFGHGRIDALLAVEAARQIADGTIPITDTPALGVNPGRVSFGATLTERNITLFNAGTGDLSIAAFTPSSSRITVTPPSDSAGVGAYTLTLNREGATAGQYMESISIASNGGNSTVNVQYEIPSINQQIAGSVGELYVFLIDRNSGEITVQQYQPNAGQYEYRFTRVDPGVYFIIAGSDPDNDGFVGGSGEALGIYPTEDGQLLVIANKSFENLDFNVTYEIPLEAASATQRKSATKDTQPTCQSSAENGNSLSCIRLISP